MRVSAIVESKKSLFDGKILLESINIGILNKLLKDENQHLLKSFDDITKDDMYTNEYVKKTYSTEKNQLQNYYNNIKFNKGFVRYDKTRNLNNYGRVFPFKSLGLFSFRKQVRGALAYGLYEDVDISNCHPTLLLQIAEHNDIKCKYLRKYVNNRDDYLNLIIETYNVDKNKAKELFIIMLYLGSFNTWKKDNSIIVDVELKFIVKLKEELKNIGSVLVDGNKNLVELIKKKHQKLNIKNKNINSSVVSFILQEYECQILETLYNHCTNKKIINNDCVLCADGLMIPKKNYNDGLLNEFNLIIKEKMGFDLTFVNKPLDTEIYDLLI